MANSTSPATINEPSIPGLSEAARMPRHASVLKVATEYSGTGDPTGSMTLLWGLQEKPKRGPKPRLTVTQITRAAIELADAEGLDAVSMRRIAEKLGGVT